MVSYKIHSSHCLDCGNQSINVENVPTWMEMTHLILYWAFPAIIGFGVLTGFLNIFTLARQIRSSTDSYLTGLTISSTFLQICGGYLWLPMYIGHFNIYQQLHGYFVSINDWFWYTSLWLTLVMSLERVLSLTQHQSRTLCSPIQACICTVMIYCVCLASSLPRFWEYEVLEYVVPKTNATLFISRRSAAASTPEYTVMYFWYLTSITTFLPLPVLLVLTCLLTKATHNSHATKRRLTENNHTQYGTGGVLARKATDEINITRLYVSIIACYILFTSPRVFFDLLPRLTVGIVDTNTHFYHTLHDIFQNLFYLNFAIQFLLFLSYYKRYRGTLGRTCCCCCCSREDDDDDDYSDDKTDQPFI